MSYEEIFFFQFFSNQHSFDIKCILKHMSIIFRTHILRSTFLLPKENLDFIGSAHLYVCVLLEYQDTGTLGHQETRIPGHWHTEIPGHWDIRIPGHWDTRIMGQQDTWSTGHWYQKFLFSKFFFGAKIFWAS